LAVPDKVIWMGSNLVFNNIYDSTVTPEYRAAILSAEHDLQSHFTASKTVVLSEEFSTLSIPGTAANSPNFQAIPYSTLVQKLNLANLSDPSNGTGDFYITTGMAKMLGLPSTSPDGTAIDGIVYLGNQLNQYFYDQSLQPGTGKRDAISAIEHELSEEMGRIGGLGQGLPTHKAWGPMDLFRYSSSGLLDTTLYTSSADVQLTHFSVGGKDISLETEFNNPGVVKADGTVLGGDSADWNPSTQQQVATEVPGGDFDLFGGAPPDQIGTLRRLI
jgi:hypothetical protein